MNRRLEKTKILCLWEHKRHHIPAVLHLPSDLKHSLPGAHWPGTLFMCPAAGEGREGRPICPVTELELRGAQARASHVSAAWGPIPLPSDARGRAAGHSLSPCIHVGDPQGPLAPGCGGSESAAARSGSLPVSFLH